MSKAALALIPVEKSPYHWEMSDLGESDVGMDDFDREAAKAMLDEYLTGGSLTQQEYDERCERIVVAKTRDDLVALFADLPEPDPEQVAGMRVAELTRLRAVSGWVFPSAFLVCFVGFWLTHSPIFFLLGFVAVLGGMIFGVIFGIRRRSNVFSGSYFMGRKKWPKYPPFE